jgi:hypothetical protein
MSGQVRDSEGKAPNAQMDKGAPTITIFRPYPLQPGDKIHIGGGPRRGDWEVMEVGDRKIKLRCPVSLRVVECDGFCFFVEKATGVPWPRHD